MAATAIHRLTLNPMGKCSNAFFSETINMIKAKLYKNVHCIKFVEDLPMIIPGQFGFNCSSGVREEAFSNISPIGSNVKLSPAVAAILNFISEQKT
jgi:hypothetical protein